MAERPRYVYVECVSVSVSVCVCEVKAEERGGEGEREGGTVTCTSKTIACDIRSHKFVWGTSVDEA